MLTSEQAARALMRWSPYSAPISWRQLARAIGASSPRAAKRYAARAHMGRHGWASAGIYADQRAALHAEWPAPLPLVRASLEELLARQRARKPAAPTGPLVVRPARAGDRYRTWNYGLRSKERDGEHRTVTTRRFDDTGRYVVLVAHEGRRLVGSTVFYFVDTLDDEQTDIHEIVGPGSIGPFFAEGDERWGGHAIVMDSVWVAPDRRRAGIATAMVDLVAQIGVPGWGEFRDPWFAAFFLHRWPPTRSMHEGSYWPVYEAYEDAVEWANDDEDEVDVNVTVWMSDSERFESGAVHRDEDPKLLLDSQLRSHEETRSSLADGGWELDVRDARIERAGDGGWRVTGTTRVMFAPDPLFACADLEDFLAAPFDAHEPFEDLSDVLAATVIATARRHAPREHARIEHWQLARPATRS